MKTFLFIFWIIAVSCCDLHGQAFWKRYGNETDVLALHSGLLYLPETDDILVSTYNMGIFRSSDQGISWQNVLRLPKDRPVFSLFESKKGFLFGGGWGRIYQSVDHGSNWVEVPLDFTSVKDFAEDANGHLFLCSADSGGILKSEDDGLTWKTCTQGLPTNYVNNLISDGNGNLFCSLVNDETDVHGGLFYWDAAANQWVEKKIRVKIQEEEFVIKITRLRSMMITVDGKFVVSMDGVVTNFAIAGIFSNTLAGALTSQLWSQEKQNDTTKNTLNVPFDRLYSTKTGHLFGSRISGLGVGVYAKMKYAYRWFEANAGIAPTGNVKTCFTEAPGGAVFLTTDFSNRIYITRESSPGKQSQRITYSLPSPMKVYEYGLLQASSSSGQVVQFKSMDNRTSLEGNRVRAIGLGPAILKAYTDGNDSYYYTEESFSILIRKAGNTITIDPPKNAMEGDTAIYVSAQATSGELVNLKVIHGNASFVKNRLDYYSPGKIQFIATEPGNNTYEIADTVTMEMCILPRKPSITSYTLSGNNGLVSSSTVGNRWYMNSIPTALQGQYIWPNQEGTYTLQIDLEGCLSEFSEPIAFTPTNLDGLHEKAEVMVYPQPFCNELFIKRTNVGNGPIQLSLMDAYGRIQMERAFSDEAITLATDKLLPGWYLLRLVSGTQTYHFKLLKRP